MDTTTEVRTVTNRTLAGLDPSYLSQLKSSRVSDDIIRDAIHAYAAEKCGHGLEADEFVDQMTTEPYALLVRKAVLDVIFCVIAASELPSDVAFRELIELLGIQEKDDLVRAVKLHFLSVMAVEGVDDASDVAEEVFYARMACMTASVS